MGTEAVDMNARAKAIAGAVYLKQTSILYTYRYVGQLITDGARLLLFVLASLNCSQRTQNNSSPYKSEQVLRTRTSACGQADALTGFQPSKNYGSTGDFRAPGGQRS